MTTPGPSSRGEWRGQRLAWAVALSVAAFSTDDRAAAESPAAWPAGHWRVRAHGGGLDCPVEALDVVADGPGRVLVVARDAAGTRWGSGRLQGPKGGSGLGLGLGLGRDRWLRANWEAGGSAVTIQLRSDRGGGLTALVRERPLAQPQARPGPERVRQLALEPVGQHAEEPVPAADAREAEGVGVFAACPDGTALRVIAAPEGFLRASRPSWSRDGRRLAFAAFDATGRDPLIRTVLAAGGPTTAVAAGTAPCWSRDAGRLAYVASGRPDFATDWDSPGRNAERIEAIRLEGTDAGNVEVLAASGLWPRWCPSDDRLAFVAHVEGNWDVYVRSADGKAVVRLTDNPAMDTAPIWSADGRSIAFLSDRGNRWDLYRVAADGKGETSRLTDHPRREDGADLSPDGETLAFHDRPGRVEGGLLTLDLAAGTVRRVLDPPRGDRDPAWSPDGKTLAFVSRRFAPLAPAPAASALPGRAGGVLGGERGGRQVAGPGLDGRRLTGGARLQAEVPGEGLGLPVRLLDRDREGAIAVGAHALGDDGDGRQLGDPADHPALHATADRLELAAGVGGFDLDLAAVLAESRDPQLQVHPVDDGRLPRRRPGLRDREDPEGGEGQGGHP